MCSDSTDVICKAKLIVFNLGYLPSFQDPENSMTRAGTTLAAVQRMSEVMTANCALSLLCYHHEEGLREERALLDWVEVLDSRNWIVVNSTWNNRPGAPTHLLLVKNK
jgi:hypothetical protein